MTTKLDQAREALCTADLENSSDLEQTRLAQQICDDLGGLNWFWSDLGGGIEFVEVRNRHAAAPL